MKYSSLYALIALCIFSLSSHAEVTLKGFASFVGGATLDSDDTYVGYENKLEYDKNSLYALQASADMGEGLTVTGQLMARGNENYKPEFEWMYASYNLTPTLNAKIGRIRTPFYMFSEYLEVGYTYHWIRPPVELYAAQVTNMDGVSLLYNLPLGSIDSQFMLSVGNRESFLDNPNTQVSDYKPLIAANAQFEMDNYILKLIYTQGNITIASTAVDAAGANFTDAAFVSNYVDVNDSLVVFAGAALDMNFHPVKVLLEFSNIDFEDQVLLADETRMLASVAYSLSDTLLVHYSWSSNLKESDSALASNATGDTLIPIGGGNFLPNSSLASTILATTDRDITTHTVGTRYDFHQSAAFKVELISTEDTKLDTSATVVRFGVDMLF